MNHLKVWTVLISVASAAIAGCGQPGVPDNPGRITKGEPTGLYRDIPLTDAATSLAFSPDGKTLAIGGKGGGVILVSVDSGKVMTERQTGTHRVTYLRWSARGTILFILGRENFLAGRTATYILDLAGMALVEITPARGNPQAEFDDVSDADLFPDGTAVVLAAKRPAAVVEVKLQGGALQKNVLPVTTDRVGSIRISRSGRQIVFVSYPDGIAPRLSLVGWPTLAIESERGICEGEDIEFDNEGRVMTFRHAGPFRLGYVFHDRDPIQLDVESGSVSAFTFSPDGKYIAVCEELSDSAPNPNVQLFSLPSGRRAATFDLPWRTANAISIAKGNRFVAATGNGHFVRVWWGPGEEGK